MIELRTQVTSQLPRAPTGLEPLGCGGTVGPGDLPSSLALGLLSTLELKDKILIWGLRGGALSESFVVFLFFLFFFFFLKKSKQIQRNLQIFSFPLILSQNPKQLSEKACGQDNRGELF